MKVLCYLVILMVIGLVWILVEPQLFRIRRISVVSEKVTQKMRVIFISDLHHGKYYYKNRLTKIVELINKQEADFVIIGGDYIGNTTKSKFDKNIIQELFAQLQLKAKLGVISVLGNHDYYFKSNMKMLLGFIKNSNITLLRNDTLELVLGKDRVLIHGVEDLKRGVIDVEKLKFNKNHLNIIVSHNPDFFEEYELNFDIGLSGHTHGGQINLFGLYAPVTESKYGQKYVRTVNKNKGATIITTKGIGCSMIPIRFFAMPEIISLEITPQ